MKVFIRESSTAEGCPSAWPNEFDTFLKNSRVQMTSKELKQLNALWSSPHGQHGARVVFSVDGYLPDAWRVSAYHSNHVTQLEGFDPENLPRSDGLLVAGRNFSNPLGIATADCLAVAITSETAEGIVSATCFHAGWRGYTGGIQQDALQKMWALTEPSGLKKNDWLQTLQVSIGPAICGRNYPCGPDVWEALNSHINRRLRRLEGWSTEIESVYGFAMGRSLNGQQNTLSDHEKIFPDLQALMVLELSAFGIGLDQLAVVREDTFSSSWWPSHRRAMAQGLTKAGRLVTHLCPPACPQVQNRVSNP